MAKVYVVMQERQDGLRFCGVSLNYDKAVDQARKCGGGNGEEVQALLDEFKRIRQERAALGLDYQPPPLASVWEQDLLE